MHVELGYLIDWHRREQKAAWWDYFCVRDLVGEEALDEPCLVTGLTHARRVGSFVSPRTGRFTSSLIEQYIYPPQGIEISAGERALQVPGVGEERDRTSEEVVLGEWFRRRRNVEAGVLLHNAAFARENRHQFDSLVTSSQVRRVPGL